MSRKDTVIFIIWKPDIQKPDMENNLQTTVLKKLSLHDALIPIEVKQLMVDFLRHCPFCMQEKIDPDDPPVSIEPDADGWFFTCYACEETRCTGYIKSDPYPVN
ncbi:MAG TPA: hypothetical protein ENH29_01985 [Bacteroidetes bacterium]|nr:hypothetical protein [Bacteroidota bacterium]